METLHQPAVKRPGRPLSFDREKVLRAAMLQFWRTGYETTSVGDLTRAMGITAPSLYAAFGDKETLFLECLQSYAQPGAKSTPERIAEAPSARHAAQDLLELSARWFTQRDAPAGCLVASAAASGSADAERVRAALRKVRKDNQKALQKRAERDVREGQLPGTADGSAHLPLIEDMAEELGHAVYAEQVEMGISRMDFRPRLHPLRCPALVFGGTEDRICAPAALAELAAALPGCTFVVLPGAGHYALLERPDETAAAVAAWFHAAERAQA